MKLKLSEAQIQRQCLLWLSAKNIFHWRSNNIPVPIKKKVVVVGFRPVYKKGLPDIFAMNGEFVAIECKTTIGRQSKEQKQFQKDFEKAGGVYLLVRDLDGLIERIET